MIIVSPQVTYRNVFDISVAHSTKVFDSAAI